jgi:hypothetical protein
MSYSEIDKPDLYFNTKLYTGNGSTQSISGVGFAPDWVWIKKRSGGTARSHQLYDVIRTATKYLHSDSTDAEGTFANGLTSFDSDGFSIGDNDGVNGNTFTYVGWSWVANGTGSSNTAGTISSTVSANTTSGFSIVSYTGTGSAATIGHGLGAVPRMIIVKNRDQADAWQVYHAANTSAPETDYLVLNTTAATADNINRWNDTLPTSTLFSIGNGVEVNTNTEKYIAYCFAEVKGYSKFSSYTGNGSTDGTFVYTGFKPAWVMVKRTDSTDTWNILDNKRRTINPNINRLFADLNQAEVTSGDRLDFLSNGFKLRTTNGDHNASGGTYIYMCFAENPFTTSSGIPVTAR